MIRIRGEQQRARWYAAALDRRAPEGEFKNGRGEFFNRELFKWNLSSAEHAGAAVIAGDATDATLMNKVVREEAPDVLILN